MSVYYICEGIKDVDNMLNTLYLCELDSFYHKLQIESS